MHIRQGMDKLGGDRPQPSGLFVDGDDARTLAALIDVVEDIEVDAVMGSDFRGG